MRPLWYTSTFYTTTEDYRGYTRGVSNQDTSSPNDQNPERRLPGSTNSAQVRKASRQEDTGRFFCISGTRDQSRSGGSPESPELKTFFQKLTTKAITPRHATPESVGYDVFTPFNFTLQPQEQRTVFIDLAITPPEGYYTQLMSKSGLAVLYELEVKAGVIDPDYTGNIGVVLKNNSESLFQRVIGEPIAQLLFVKVVTPKLVQVQNLTPTQRGRDGFGTHSAISTSN